VDHSLPSAERFRRASLPVLVLSGLGFPLSQVAISRQGRRGAVLVEGISTALLARDAYLVSSGTLGRLRPVPAVLLSLEFGAALCASVLGLRTLTSQGIDEATRRRPGKVEFLRRAALGTLFGLHSSRFAIYLGADRGLAARRPTSGAPDPT